MNRKNQAFTLVEILIVVIILGILAAVVIPQFTEASNDARESALLSDLQTVRSQIELYKVQHLEKTPDLNHAVPPVADTANFTARMTEKTDDTGLLNASGALGPYLQSFPKNPFASNLNTVSFGTAACPGDGTTGWYFKTDTGKFSANDSAHKDS